MNEFGARLADFFAQRWTSVVYPALLLSPHPILTTHSRVNKPPPLPPPWGKSSI